MKLKKKTQEQKAPQKKSVEAEEDYDFDFSIYEDEEKKADSLQSIKKLNKPRITGLRSKFSPSMMQLESLEAIRTKISVYAIKVAARSQEIHELWKLYGCLDEYWARIHDIYGTVILKEIVELKQKSYQKLVEADQQSQIGYDVHELLLTLRDRIYIAAQRANLGLEVEKTSFSHYDRAKKGIIE